MTLAIPAAYPASHVSQPLSSLPELALRVRERILRLATRGGCFVGASLSCADLLVHLYTRVLQVTPETVADPGRDYLFLSKGHDVPALYATFAELGFLDPARLDHHLSTRDSIYWHPNRAVPGVEFHSGSLGHLLAVALGVAYDIRLRGGENRVFVVLGDGELDEGSIWEACLVAAAWKLDNLVAVVDRNEFQANGRTEELIPLEPLPAKLRAFGWACRTVDGHCRAADLLVTIEDHFLSGGLYSIVAEVLLRHGVACRVHPISLGERWFKPALLPEVLESAGFTGDWLAGRVSGALAARR